METFEAASRTFGSGKVYRKEVEVNKRNRDIETPKNIQDAVDKHSCCSIFFGSASGSDISGREVRSPEACGGGEEAGRRG